MTVAALVKGNGKDEMIPVATEFAFDEIWLPRAEALGLIWVPLFQSGLDVRREDWGDIVSELRRLRASASKDTDVETRDYLIERIDRLINEIPEFLFAPDGEVTIC